MSTGRRGPGSTSSAWVSFELFVSVAMLGAAALLGLLLAKHPGEDRVDAAGYFYVPAGAHVSLAEQIVKLGSLKALVAGCVLIFLISIFRDWVRAFVRAISPGLAVLVVEHVAKPMVGRDISTGGYTYPSGTVTAIAAVAAGLYLAVPLILKPLFFIAGSGAIVAVGISVLVLRWHYPTDVVGGVLVGVGFVFACDAIAHGLWRFGTGSSTPQPRERGAPAFR